MHEYTTFLYLVYKMESTHKAILLHTGCPQGNALWAIVWTVHWTSPFFQAPPIYLKEQLTEYYGNSDVDVRQIFSWKWTKWACHFKENNLTNPCCQWNNSSV